MSDLSDFKRQVYEPELANLRLKLSRVGTAYRFTREALIALGCQERSRNGGDDCEDTSGLADEDWCVRCAALSNASDAFALQSGSRT